VSAPTAASAPTQSVPERTVRPRRPLPGSRAVVGALLVVLAAVGTFVAYLEGTSPPETRFLVADVELRPGQVLTTADVEAAFRAVAVELPPEQAGRALAADAAQQLVGATVLAPVTPEDLVVGSLFARPGEPGAGVSLSFPIAAERAFAGRVVPGEQVDLLVTLGDTTRVVARGIRVADVVGAGDGVGAGSMVLTVLLPDLATAQEVLAAADNGRVALARGADPAEASGPGVRADDQLPRSDAAAVVPGAEGPGLAGEDG